MYSELGRHNRCYVKLLQFNKLEVTEPFNISYCAVVFGMNTLYEWQQTRQLRAESNKS